MCGDCIALVGNSGQLRKGLLCPLVTKKRIFQKGCAEEL